MNTFLYFILLSPFLYLFYNILLYFKTKVPIIITPKEYYDELFNNFSIPKNCTIYELGCSKGDFLFAVEKFEPKKIVGFELSPLHVWYGKTKAKIKKSKVKIKYQDFFKADITDADLIYLFLVEPILIKLWKKIKNEAKPGTIVVVLSDRIPGEKYFQKIATRPNKQDGTFYYLYRT